MRNPPEWHMAFKKTEMFRARSLLILDDTMRGSCATSMNMNFSETSGPQTRRKEAAGTIGFHGNCIKAESVQPAIPLGDKKIMAIGQPQPQPACFKTRRIILKSCVAGIAGAVIGSPASAQTAPARQLDVPFEPSPQQVVNRMLELAKVNKDDLLYDLGSGDGRIVVTAAKKFGVRGVGIDLDPQRVAEAKANARIAGVEDKVRFMVGDLYKSDFSEATVVTLFLFPQVNLQLRPQLWQQLKIGTRVVSYIWDMGAEWPPERIETVNGKKIYFWTITELQKNQAGR